MKDATRLRKALKELSADPELRHVIARARRGSAKKRPGQIESLAGLYLLAAAIVARLSKRKRARALDEHIDIVRFLVQLSLLLKENVLDRPEVRKMFSRSAERISLVTRASLGLATPKRKRQRQAAKGRPARSS